MTPLRGLTLKEIHAQARRALAHQKEVDPTGRIAGEPGAKLDAGKPMASLLLDFNLALIAVAEAATFGAQKYSRGGWKEVPEGYIRYTDALLRHILAGDEDDKDSSLLHDAHIAWNALARLQLKLQSKSDTVEVSDEVGEARGWRTRLAQLSKVQSEISEGTQS